MTSLLERTAECPHSFAPPGQKLDSQVHGRPDLPRFLQAQAQRVQCALAEVNDLTAEEWLDAFRRAPEPEREMLFWVEAARRYTHAVMRQAEMPINDRKRLLHRILAAL